MVLTSGETFKPSDIIAAKDYLGIPGIALYLIFLADQQLDEQLCKGCSSKELHLGPNGILGIDSSSLPKDPSFFPLCSRVYYSGRAETSRDTFPSRRTVVIFSHENQDPEALKNLPCGLMGKTA